MATATAITSQLLEEEQIEKSFFELVFFAAFWAEKAGLSLEFQEEGARLVAASAANPRERERAESRACRALQRAESRKALLLLLLLLPGRPMAFVFFEQVRASQGLKRSAGAEAMGGVDGKSPTKRKTRGTERDRFRNVR